MVLHEHYKERSRADFIHNPKVPLLTGFSGKFIQETAPKKRNLVKGQKLWPKKTISF